MKKTWNKIKTWLEENAPQILEGMNEGASDELIREAEDLFGVQFPKDFKKFYKIHNGEGNADGDDNGLLPGLDRLSSIEEMIENWKAISEDFEGEEEDPDLVTTDIGVKPYWWHARWIPITDDGCGDHICLDFDPALRGKVGQVIGFEHDEGFRHILAQSFREWLDQYAEDLLKGKYVYDGYCIVEKEK